MSGPYRSTALVVAPSHRERAFCPWCAHSTGRGSSLVCTSMAKRTPWGASKWAEHVNRDGDCDGYELSRWTRLLRRLRLRSPVLIATEETVRVDAGRRALGRIRSGARSGKVAL
jgi:hypothetical protein